jgi:hypothetical protein
VLLLESSRSFPLLHVGPCRRFLSELDEAPCLARFSTFLSRSSEFSIFSGWVLGLLGVVFASLLDLYRASRSCYEVLNELISEFLLSTLKPCINTKLQNRHAQVNLLYHGGWYQWIRYKSYASTEGKLMARLTEFHRQHQIKASCLCRPVGWKVWNADGLLTCGRVEKVRIGTRIAVEKDVGSPCSWDAQQTRVRETLM